MNVTVNGDKKNLSSSSRRFVINTFVSNLSEEKKGIVKKLKVQVMMVLPDLRYEGFLPQLGEISIDGDKKEVEILIKGEITHKFVSEISKDFFDSRIVNYFFKFLNRIENLGVEAKVSKIDLKEILIKGFLH